MQIGTRLRCYPPSAVQSTLWKWIGAQEFIYNCKTGEDRYFRMFARKSLSLAGQYPPVDQAYSQFRATKRAWIKGTPSQVLRNGAVKWYQAYQRFFKKLGGRPGMKNRQGKRSVWLTSELFRFPGAVDDEAKPGQHIIEIGTVKKPLGTIRFNARAAFRVPSSVHIAMEHGHWHLSFSFDDDKVEPSDEDTAAWLRQHCAAELEGMTIGFDRGVVAPVVGSDGSRYGYTDVQLRRMAKKEKAHKRWQRRMARRLKSSKRYARARARARAAKRYGVNVRRDFAHQTSHAIVVDDHVRLIVFEALKLRNITAVQREPLTRRAGMYARRRGSIAPSLMLAWER
jgi:putative transposase